MSRKQHKYNMDLLRLAEPSHTGGKASQMNQSSSTVLDCRSRGRTGRSSRPAHIPPVRTAAENCFTGQPRYLDLQLKSSMRLMAHLFHWALTLSTNASSVSTSEASPATPSLQGHLRLDDEAHVTGRTMKASGE
ncbi:MAG: hypothetical protein M1835_003297 [Candelina submexicana]|nr:MAG: hypothetical protein M1835_003297 [Candelina submexicana]